MLRFPASRAVLRSLTPVTARMPLNAAANKSPLASRLCTLSNTKRPHGAAAATWKPPSAPLLQRQRYASTQWDKVDKKAEQDVAHKKLEPEPELVSTTSSIHPIFGEVGTPEPEKEQDMMKGIKQDVETIKDTFSLTEVPRQAYVLGLAGVLPYLGTSLSTVACAYEVNHAAAGADTFLSQHTAEVLLHVLEPLQVGYGAVIISFLGAIHWGLEWAGYGGYQGYRRYAIGVAAPAVAWPTILLPVEYALIAQFMAFNFLYYADTRATVRGWTPPWYGTYRFVLTFIVGASIVVSLIGRGQIVENVGKLPNPVDRVMQLREGAEEALEKEEEARRAAVVAREEGDESARIPGGDPEIKSGL
ncbi:mitochondrial inner membrane protein 1 [Diplodia corticola]|uniref:Mitochondrial inner membrane protein 1 n=1 Tax=Diplodia corticola TaxID=236234 RepID=A0A1J9RGQ6_9PEZI|nr:mitochondrial inner membrane protein 1 [Diplodia corticola]OJD40726.1 mitochondrial inner membrane protein 1 [Diplodia corticola]